MIEDGGPAFPGQTWDYGAMQWDHHDGNVSLRDYFAAAALEGLLAGQWCVVQGTDTSQSVPKNCDDLAVNAYALADAMLKAREQ